MREERDPWWRQLLVELNRAPTADEIAKQDLEVHVASARRAMYMSNRPAPTSMPGPGERYSG